MKILCSSNFEFRVNMVSVQKVCSEHNLPSNSSGNHYKDSSNFSFGNLTQYMRNWMECNLPQNRKQIDFA